jgi:hypothetical protein
MQSDAARTWSPGSAKLAVSLATVCIGVAWVSPGHFFTSNGGYLRGRFERQIADPNVCVDRDHSYISGMRSAFYLLRLHIFDCRT